jgi:ankyrin repeat protein
MPQVDRIGRIPLHYAALTDDEPAAEAELAAGADVGATDRQGFTALHFAAQQGSQRVAAMLIARGAIVDAVDQWGNTPLYRAVFNYRGDPATILFLRHAGADLDHRNASVVSPRALAARIANCDVALWLRDDLGPSERASLTNAE